MHHQLHKQAAAAAALGNVANSSNSQLVPLPALY
jgi:hypothetical protein